MTGRKHFRRPFPIRLRGRPIFSPSQKFEEPAALQLSTKTERFRFQPEDSDWVFSAAIRYGRSSNNRHVHQQTYPHPTDVIYVTNRTIHYY